MTVTDLLVIGGGAGLIAVLAWYFFAPRAAAAAQLEGGRQVVDITVRGGYSPNLVRVHAGTPVRLRFHRQKGGDCTARVVFPDLRRSASLAAFGTTTLDLRVDEPGEYGWACGMNMLHGTLIAGPPAGPGARPGDTAEPAPMPSPLAPSSMPVPPEQGGGEDTEAAAHRAEVRDLTRRVTVGALLTLPVLYAAMVGHFVGAQYVPDPLENPYLQLLLTLPVFLWWAGRSTPPAGGPC